MTIEIALKIKRGIEDKIEANVADMDDWAEFWGFSVDEYESFLDMAIKALEQEPTTKNDLVVDCISRQAVIDELKRYFHDEYYQRTSIQDCRDCFIEDVLNNLPSVTPQPKTGHWIEDAKTYYEELEKRGLGVDEYTPYFTDDIACSECLAKYSNIDNETQFFKYCPNCGARMIEPQESEET